MKFLYDPVMGMNGQAPGLTQLFGADPVAVVDTWYGNTLVKAGEHVYKVLANQAGHNGIDIARHRGDPIYAPADGWIIEQTAKDTGYGLRISIRHDVGGEYFFSLYGHMERLEMPINVKWNWNNKTYPVKLGQVIGYIDSTGASSGDHLHWSLYAVDSNGTKLNPNNGYGGAVDPFLYSFRKEIPMNSTKVVLSKDGKTVYVATPIAMDWENFKKQAGVEGIQIPSPIPPSSSL